MRPTVTVATIVPREGAFLFVEEQTPEGLRLNQPAGHLEAGESIVEAARRETLEETGWYVRPVTLVGIYRWRAAEGAPTFVRFAFVATPEAHDAGRALDEGIVRALWLGYDEVAARRAMHRSPLVMRCLDDFRAGASSPLAILADVA